MKHHTIPINKITLSTKIQQNPILKDLLIDIDEDIPLKYLIIIKHKEFLASTSKEKKTKKKSGFHRKVD